MHPTCNWRPSRLVRMSVVMLLAGFLAMPIASAKNAKRGSTPEERLEKTMPELKQLLTLSDEQEAQVRTFYQDYYDKLQALRDTSQGKSKSDREKYREERQNLRDELEAQLDTTLTKEQMEKYRKYQEERRKEMRKKRGGSSEDKDN